MSATVLTATHLDTTCTWQSGRNPSAASTEVSQLGGLFIGRVFLPEDATVQRVTTAGAKASYLHFATHGLLTVLNERELSLLAGQPDRLSVKDLIEDNYKLTFSERVLPSLRAKRTLAFRFRGLCTVALEGVLKAGAPP